eukprot:g4641.t1
MIQAFVNYDSGAIPSVLETIKEEFEVSEAALGILGCIPYLGITVAAPIFGVLLNKHSQKRVLIVALACNAGFCALLAFSYRYWQLLAPFVIYSTVWVEEFAPVGAKTLWVALLQVGVPLGVMLGVQCISLGVFLCLLGYVPTRYVDNPWSSPAMKEWRSKFLGKKGSAAGGSKNGDKGGKPGGNKSASSSSLGKSPDKNKTAVTGSALRKKVSSAGFSRDDFRASRLLSIQRDATGTAPASALSAGAPDSIPFVSAISLDPTVNLSGQNPADDENINNSSSGSPLQDELYPPSATSERELLGETETSQGSDRKESKTRESAAGGAGAARDSNDDDDTVVGNMNRSISFQTNKSFEFIDLKRLFSMTPTSEMSSAANLESGPPSRPPGLFSKCMSSVAEGPEEVELGNFETAASVMMEHQGPGGAPARPSAAEGSARTSTAGGKEDRRKVARPLAKGASKRLVPSTFTRAMRLRKNHVFVLCILTLSVLYFVVTGVQYWATIYLTEVFRPPHESEEDFKVRVIVWFSIVAATGPALGVVTGGLVIDALGGYDGLHHRIGTIKALLLSAALATACGMAACVVPPGNNLGEFYTVVALLCGNAAKNGFFTPLMWLLLFFGGAMVPALTGMMLSVVPNDFRATASAVAQGSFNVLGFVKV